MSWFVFNGSYNFQFIFNYGKAFQAVLDKVAKNFSCEFFPREVLFGNEM